MPSRSAAGHAAQQGGKQGGQQRRLLHRPKDARVGGGGSSSSGSSGSSGSRATRSSRAACRFHFSPGGCRRGDRCHFSHACNSSVDDAPNCSSSTNNNANSENNNHNHNEKMEMPPAAGAGGAGGGRRGNGGVASPPLPPPPPSSWVGDNGNARASLPDRQPQPQPPQEFAYRRYSSPTPDANPYMARTDLESLLRQSMVMGMGGFTSAEHAQQPRKSSKEQLLMASLGLTSDDLHLAVHGSAPTGVAGDTAGAACAPDAPDRTIEHVHVKHDIGEVRVWDSREEYEQNEEEMEATTACKYTSYNNDESAGGAATAAESNATRPPRSLLSPITLAEAEHNLSKLTTLSQSWRSVTDPSGNQRQMEEFNAALQMCRSVQMTVVEVLQRTMLTSQDGGGEEEEELVQLLELNESLLSTIADAEQSLVGVRNGVSTSSGDAAGTACATTAAAAAAGGSNAEQQRRQRRAEAHVDPAEAMGLPRGYLAQLPPEDYEALEKRDAEVAYSQKYGRTKEQDFGLTVERSAELAEEERQAEAERKLAQKLGLASANADAGGGGGEAPKKAKKKRIRKKKNKGTTNANDADAADSKPKTATHTPEELAKIKAEELEATRRAEAAAAEAAERAKQDERDRLARMREEARKQQAAARERKKAKKVQKYQRKVAEQVEAEAVRTKLWEEERAKSKGRTKILESLCITELIRQSSTKVMGLSFSRVQEDDSAMTSIRDVSNKAYQELYKHDIKLRVVVTGVDTSGGGNSNGKKELNGRLGTIISYDETKGEYSVALDTKKGKQDDLQSFKPENLDVAKDGVASAAQSKKAKSSGKGKKNGSGAKGHNVDHSYGISLPTLLSYGGVSLDLEYFLVSQSDVVEVEKASTLDAGLKAFSAKRAEEERIQKLLEEEERAREAEARKRRAELRAREEEDRRRRQADKERDREEMLEFLRKQKERMAAGDDDDSDEGHHHRRQYYDSDEEDYDDDDDYGYGEHCDCAQCRMRARMHDYMFMSMFGGGMRGGGMGPMPHPIFMSMFGGMGGMGGMPFGPGMGGFYGEDDDDDEYYEEEEYGEEDFFKHFFFGGGFDDAYEEREARRLQEENEEQAEILGVPVDADAKTIKTKYRRLAIQYHPDKWRQDSDHGMTKEDAEEEFKRIQSAYDHLMSNFDEDE